METQKEKIRENKPRKGSAILAASGLAGAAGSGVVVADVVRAAKKRAKNPDFARLPKMEQARRAAADVRRKYTQAAGQALRKTGAATRNKTVSRIGRRLAGWAATRFSTGDGTLEALRELHARLETRFHEFFDRERDGMGRFAAQETGGIDPNSMSAAYKQKPTRAIASGAAIGAGAAGAGLLAARLKKRGVRLR